MTSIQEEVSSLTLWIHESAQDVIWNPGPTEEGIESEDYVYIEPECQAERAEPQDAKVPIGGLVSRRTASSMSAPTPTSAVPNSAAAGSTSGNIGRQQLSVSQAVAQSFGWSSRIKVLAFRLPKDLPKEHQATYVELSFRDYHLGRPDMLRLNQALVEQPVYLGQRLIIPNAVGSTAKCTVTQIWVRGRQRRSAVVTLETDLVYRSQSARVFLCLQISSEMNHFGVDGSLYSEKLLDHFLPTLFRKWHGTNHALSIVLFSRIIYEDHELPHLQAHQKDVLNKDHAGRACLDVYKTVVDMQAGFRWSDIESLLTQELRHFERRILLEYSQRSDGGLAGRMSEAHDGNVLEMLNLASRVFESSHIDRDLSRTCRSIILVTPGTCRFTVAKSLLRLTSERLVNGAASVDLVSLCKIPLHDVPVFAFKSVDPSAYYAKSGARSTSQQRRNVSKSRYHARLDTPDRPAESIPSSTSTMDLARSFQEMPGAMQAIMRSARRGRSQKAPPPRVYDPLYFDLSPEEAARSKSKWFYCIADWIDASFYSPQPDKPFRADRYMPRMVMQEVESLGVESDSAVISLPLLPRSKAGPGQGDAQERQLERDRMDDMTCGWHEPRKKRVSDNSKKSERFDLGNGLKPALPKMKRQDSTNTEATATASPRRGRPFYRAPSSSASATTTVASSTLALTPLKTKERSPSVSSRSSRRTPSVNVLSPTTTGSTASGQFTPVLMSRMNTKATPAPPTTGTKASTATGWLTGLLGGKSTLSKPQINLQRPDISIDSQAETSLRSASPARNEQKNSSTSVAPIAIGKPAPTSQTDDPMSLTLGTSVPSSIDSRLSLIPQKPKPIPSAATEASLTAFRVNPCNPTHNRGLPMHQIGRWGQPFDQHHVQWKSLCSPANLPLHLDWLPTAAELASHYDHGSYQIPIFPSSSSTFVYAQPTVEEQASHVLREMLFQRLGQGFQILRPSKGSIRSADRVSSSLAQPRQMRAMLQQADFSSGKSIFVIYARNVHQLSYAAGQVTVHVFMRHKFFDSSPMAQSFVIWPKLSPNFEKRRCQLSYTAQEVFDFPTLDNLIAGTGHKGMNPFTQSTRFWRSRYLVLPSPVRDRHSLTTSITEGLTASSPDEDIRLAGIIKLYNFFQNGQWNSSNNFNRTNLSYCFVESELPSEYGIEEAESAKAEAEARNRQSKPVVPLKSIPLGDLAIAMRNPKFGLKMQTRRWNVRSFDYTFTGSEFVDWLQTIFIEVREDRQASLGDCKQLLSKHFFRALGSDRSFSDSPTAYYQLAAPFRPNKSTNWFDSSSIPKGASKGQETLNGPVMIGEPQYTRPMADHKEDQLVIKMSDAVILDFDPQRKGDRTSLAQAHIDIIHNPSSPLHFQLNWMTSPLGIDEMLRTLARTIDKYGLRLVENSILPCTELSESSPLMQHTRIPFASSPTAIEGVQDPDKLTYCLLKQFGFLLGDVESSSKFQGVRLIYTYRQRDVTRTEWVHESGVANVAILDNGEGLLFQPNRLLLSKPGIRHAEIPPVEQIHQELSSFCANKDTLGSFWSNNAKDGAINIK